MRFEDRVAVVTGGASGFGEAIARRIAREGARVAVADRDLEGATRVASTIEEAGGVARAFKVDVSVSSEVAALFGATVDAFGGVDVLVNNAGFSHRAMALVDLPEDEFDRVFATNTKGVYLGAVYGVPHLRARGGGAIVNTASIGAVRPRPNFTAYNATKAAVVTLTRGLATELGPDGIRVNAVCPLASETGFMKSALGVENAFEIASATETVVALAMGLEDYTADLGVTKTLEGQESLYARMRLVNAARAAGVQANDSVFSDVGDSEGLFACASRSRNMGYEGMGCIHPRQIKLIHEAYTPTSDEISRAQEICVAFDAAELEGLSVVSLGSRMIDPPVVLRAKRLIENARRAGLI